MSSPVAIPRTERTARDLTPSSGSPTGLYVPVHKRNASAASSLTSERPASPPRSPRSHPHKRGQSRASPAPSHASPVPSASPLPTAHPRVYDIRTLLALSASPLATLSPAQLGAASAILPFVVPSPTSASASEKRAAGRRRPARKGSAGKKLVASMQADVESRRKRHGTWGWQVPAGPGESWRHGPVAPVSA